MLRLNIGILSFDDGGSLLGNTGLISNEKINFSNETFYVLR